jgi:hypothetical protein
VAGQRDRAVARLDHLHGVLAADRSPPAIVAQQPDREALVERLGHRSMELKCTRKDRRGTKSLTARDAATRSFHIPSVADPTASGAAAYSSSR